MIPPLGRGKPTSVADLRMGTLYVAPSGRLCRMAVAPRRAIRGDCYGFDYVDPPPNDPGGVDGFWLSGPNVRLLRLLRQVTP